MRTTIEIADDKLIKLKKLAAETRRAWLFRTRR